MTDLPSNAVDDLDLTASKIHDAYVRTHPRAGHIAMWDNNGRRTVVELHSWTINSPSAMQALDDAQDAGDGYDSFTTVVYRPLDRRAW